MSLNLLIYTGNLPFRSSKQERYMWLFHPAIAKKWTTEYGSFKSKKKSKGGKKRAEKKKTNKKKRRTKG